VWKQRPKQVLEMMAASVAHLSTVPLTSSHVVVRTSRSVNSNSRQNELNSTAKIDHRQGEGPQYAEFANRDP
jgi:hypothetical protein